MNTNSGTSTQGNGAPRPFNVGVTFGDQELAHRVVGQALPDGARAATLAAVYKELNMEKRL